MAGNSEDITARLNTATAFAQNLEQAKTAGVVTAVESHGMSSDLSASTSRSTFCAPPLDGTQASTPAHVAGETLASAPPLEAQVDAATIRPPTHSGPKKRKATECSSQGLDAEERISDSPAQTQEESSQTKCSRNGKNESDGNDHGGVGDGANIPVESCAGTSVSSEAVGSTTAADAAPVKVAAKIHTTAPGDDMAAAVGVASGSASDDVATSSTPSSSLSSRSSGAAKANKGGKAASGKKQKVGSPAKAAAKKNTAPRKKVQSRGTSKYVGVRWHRASQKWQSQIYAGGTVTHLGLYDSEVEAAKKFDERAILMGRPVNFPDPSADPPQKQAAKQSNLASQKTETEKKARATQEAALAAVGTVDEASTAAAAARAKQEAERATEAYAKAEAGKVAVGAKQKSGASKGGPKKRSGTQKGAKKASSSSSSSSSSSQSSSSSASISSSSTASLLTSATNLQTANATVPPAAVQAPQGQDPEPLPSQSSVARLTAGPAATVDLSVTQVTENHQQRQQQAILNVSVLLQQQQRLQQEQLAMQANYQHMMAHHQRLQMMQVAQQQQQQHRQSGQEEAMVRMQIATIQQQAFLQQQAIQQVAMQRQVVQQQAIQHVAMEQPPGMVIGPTSLQINRSDVTAQQSHQHEVGVDVVGDEADDMNEEDLADAMAVALDDSTTTAV